MMKPVLQTIRILVVIFVSNIRCQDGFSDRDILRLQQMASNEGQIETITSYNSNIIQREPNSQSMSSMSVQYHMTDPDKNEDYNRADRVRGRKVYRIKNPFDHQEQQEETQTNTETPDSGTGASNQYAAMQYSLPPEDFLQQMRAENQYYQQQQQPSTQTPQIGYTATPQPQYQYSTIASNYGDSIQQSTQIPHIEPKMSHSQTYYNQNNYQYGGLNSYGLDNVQSTPTPIASHLSTALPISFLSTQSNGYVSSSSPIYISSPSNLQHYVSSPLSPIQASSPDYNNNRVTTAINTNSLSYGTNDLHKKMLDHYDNAVNGIRYPMNVQQQYSNDYPSSTPTPSPSPYSDSGNDSWRSSVNSGTSALSKSLQDMTLSQYQNYPYSSQVDVRSNSNGDNINSDTHRVGNMPAANTLYLNFAQPEYPPNNSKSRTKEVEQDNNQAYYSHGDYGWKLSTRKPEIENYPTINYNRYHIPGQTTALQPSSGSAVSQMSFHMDSGRSHHGYDQVSKSSPDNIEAQEFARAAAKIQERQQQQQQQQQQQHLYESSYSPNYNNPMYVPTPGPPYANNDKQRNRFNDNTNSNSYIYSTAQTDLITVSPYYYLNSKENIVDTKPKQPFDHDKALKNIVPIDVSNVVANSDSQFKAVAGLDNNNRFNFANFGKDQLEQNLKQYYKSVTDAYYKDKNSIYGFNIKSKPDELLLSDNKHLNTNMANYPKQTQVQETAYNQGNFHDNKSYLDGATSTFTFSPPQNSNYPDTIQSSANIQQQSLQRQQNQISSDIANILKLNDSPYRLSSGLPEADVFRLHSNFDQAILPTPLPGRINQNVGSHQLDVSILNKLLNKQTPINLNRPDLESQSNGILSTINGIKVANPFNVDLKLVADMLKGKPAIDDTHLLPLRDQYKTLPLKLDLSQLQQLLLKNENNGNFASINEGLSAFANPYLDLYGSSRLPYQGVKYSRSQEEEESIIPIADSSNNHPIGAVIEQLDGLSNEREVSTGTDIITHDDEVLPNNFDSRPKNTFISGNRISDRHRHPNTLSGQHYHRKFPKSDIGEPYPLLKPPPRLSRNRGSRNKLEGRRHRISKPKVVRIMKTEPLFEAGSDIEEESTVPTLLRPPPPIANAKVDVVQNEEDT